MRPHHRFAALYAVILTAFTLYILLDTFAIARVIQQVPTAPTAEATTPPPQQVQITESSYQDGNISISITEYREYDTSIYVADVQLSSPDLLKTALAENAYGRNLREKTSEMAQSHGAILAINGDYYGSREEGYVLRNGVLYRSDGDTDRQDLVIYDDGGFGIVSEKNVTAQNLQRSGAWQIFSFGPALVQNSQVSVDEDTEVDQATYSNPRTAIAIVDDLHYLLVVSDGRTERSEGLSLYQLAQFLQSLGAKTAYNLDGGGSSTMWFNGKLINEPVDHGSKVSERKVSDIVYIGY
ncbi:MAG: phosphodiester glycosidase family protein [Oscillospiraceae bacterium]|nr:phosphodiester glycosidase family protein [Oscillospiraceae bacterium]